MERNFIEITIRRVKKPVREEINSELQWISQSLGLFSKRDKEKSCFRIFIELVKAKKEGIMLSSDEIAEKSHLTRGTVIHHIAHLVEKDMIKVHRNRYGLSFSSFDVLVNNIEKNFSKMLKDLEKEAKKIDRELGF